MPTVKCDNCGKEKQKIPFHIKNWVHHFCNRNCYSEWLAKQKVVVKCDNCGEEIKKRPSYIKKSEHHFCNHKCRSEWVSKHGGVIINCDNCGITIKKNPYTIRVLKHHFCSHKCKGEWQTIYLKGESNPFFGRFHSEDSRKMMRIARRGIVTGEQNGSWKGGISFEPYCPKFNDVFKEKIREKFNRICFLCPTTEEENGEKLCVHHVNYNKNCLCDDVKCEFVPVCRSCHTKTNNNREYWESIILTKLQGENRTWKETQYISTVLN